MHSRTHVPVAALTVVVLVGLAGCQGQQAAPTAIPAASTTAATAAKPVATMAASTAPAATAAGQAAATSAAAAPKTLKVGFSATETGPSGRGGIMSRRTYSMIIDDLNAQGGIKVGADTYRIEYVSVDDKGTADGGREAADRLMLAEKVKLVLGPLSNAPYSGAQPSVEQANALMFGPGGSSEAVLGPKHPTSIGAGNNYYPRLGSFVNYVTKTHPQLKSIGLLTTNDTTGKNDTAILQEVMEGTSLVLVTSEVFPSNTSDFSPIVLRLLSKKPDIVLIGTVPGATVASSGIIKALAEQNFKGPILGATAYTSLPNAGAAAEGYVAPYLMEPNAAVLPAALKDIFNRFVQKYGEADFEPAQVMSQALAPQVLFQAIAKAGTVDDTMKIAEVMRSSQWDTAVGKLGFSGAKTFGAPAYLQAPIFLSRIQGGKWVTFDMQPATVP